MEGNYSDARRKYLKAPTLKEMLDFVREVGVSYYAFEYFFGIPYGMIKCVKAGYKQMPPKYWYIFYEKIIPQYGVGFNKDVTKIVSTTVSKPKKQQRKNPSKDNRLVVIQ